MSKRTANRRATPKHLWGVGIFALLWSAMGAFDYLMTETQNEAYMSNFTPQQLDFFYGFPAWAVSAWAIAVWGGVLGAVLLLLRNRWATPVFLASFLGMLVTNVYGFVLNDWVEIMGTGFAETAFTAAIFLFALAFYLYARAMEKRGVLG